MSTWEDMFTGTLDAGFPSRTWKYRRNACSRKKSTLQPPGRHVRMLDHWTGGMMKVKRRRAATIIELAIVLSVASAFCAIALPRVAGFIDSIEVRGAVTEIESLFSLARHAAIARGSQSVVDIDESAGVFSIRVGTELIRSRDVGAAHGVTVSSGRTSMTYSPIGVGYGAANFSLSVARGIAADTIVISRLGRVRHQ
jgi:Tfp pilus assembly protein FimT